MSFTVTPEELVAAFREQWPLQYEITALRLVNAAQARQIAALDEESSSSSSSSAV